MLKSSWLAGDANETTVVDWVQKLKHRMESMAAIVGLWELAAKTTMTKSYDKTTTHKDFSL